MYLKKLVYKNVGPLEDVIIDVPFNDDGSPKPMIIVGKNGSGKSTLLSNIVDSFYEMAGKAFNDVRYTNSNNTYQYYKIISSDHIKIGKKYLYSYIEYDDSIEYLFKCGEFSFEVLHSELSSCSPNLNWGNQTNYKNITANEKQVKEIFGSNIFCFFGADRYEKPSWIGDKYYIDDMTTQLSVNTKYNGQIPNPITVKNVAELSLQWLLDLIVDSRTDIQNNNGQLVSAHIDIRELLLLGSARDQVEKILSTIIKKDVYFGLNFRNSGRSRFNIRLKNTNQIIIPTLDSLSTGEIALFNIFSTIIRYADRLNINNSIHFDDISGIVIIDEIELHLHSSLQRDVLPTLIKLFPKVQFIITTHSPLFLLGMREQFGDNGFDIVDLPSGDKINTEAFSEFQNAFEYMMNTQRYQNEVNEAIKNANKSKTLIITEGATDWRHIKAAMNALSQQEENNDLFKDIDVNFLEYDPKNFPKSSESSIKLEMGNSTLCSMCKEFAKITQHRKMIFIADRDNPDTNKTLGDTTQQYKNWGNNVYSIILPVPLHRESTPNICIEHYYTDNEIKTPTEINGVKRRLYMGNEFDEHGRGICEGIMCEKPKICGAGKINIIEGSQGERVLQSQYGCNDNLALSKMQFAENILEGKFPFDNFNFDSFLGLFQIIDEIIKLPMV